MTATQDREDTVRRPASGVTIDPEQLSRLRALKPISVARLAQRTGQALYRSGWTPPPAQAARALWLTLGVGPADIIQGLPDGMPAARVPLWLRHNPWTLDDAAVTRLREARGWNEKQLTEAASRYWYSRDQIAKIERGERRPSHDALAVICRILGCRVADLIPGSTELPDTGETRKDRVDRNRKMREWADAQDPPVPYRNASGRIKYSKDLKDRYKAHLASQDKAELIGELLAS